jgi:hypothetical protein
VRHAEKLVSVVVLLHAQRLAVCAEGRHTALRCAVLLVQLGQQLVICGVRQAALLVQQGHQLVAQQLHQRVLAAVGDAVVAHALVLILNQLKGEGGLAEVLQT